MNPPGQSSRERRTPRCATHWILAAIAALSPVASASDVVVSTQGPGGAIPDGPDVSGVGKWGPPWESPLYWPALISPVTVASHIDRVRSIVIQGFEHAWKGDLHVYLENPSGQLFNLIVRPGYQGSPWGTGYGLAFVFGDYTIVESGGASLLPYTSLEGGTYDQFLNTGPGMWSNSAILNAPLSWISGPAGTWKLHLRDWSPLEDGSITGWVLHGENDGDASSFCFGDNANAETNCPCAPGAPGSGCANSSGVGAVLAATGSASVAANDLRLVCTGMLPGSASMFFQGTHSPNGGFGEHSNTTDGLLCLSPFMLRVDRKGTLGSVASVGDIVRHGGIPAAGGLRRYQVYYRNIANYCTPSTWNTSNAVRVWWNP